MNMAVNMDFEQARFNMIEQQIRPWEVLDPAVLDLLSQVKREEFVPEGSKLLAFADVELPLANGSTMLEPKVEARLLQEAGVKASDKVLEIGTGSGYMAALLASRAASVTSVEIDGAQLEVARQNLARAGIANVNLVKGDGARGWPNGAPFDVIVVSASLPVLPAEMLQQLKVGGRLVAIVGEAPAMEAQLVTRTGETTFNTVNLFETVTAPLKNAVQREQFVF
mgnify:CR=1 FL=1